MKKVVFLLIFLLALGLGAYFFRDLIFPSGEGEPLIIVMNTEATDLSPYGLNLNNATRIRNIYEGLVAFDTNLKIIPSLAVSWGNTSETSWEFRLREGVLFHDGSILEPQDVVDTFENAKSSGNSQIQTHIRTIKEVAVGSDNRVVITTHSPDPLLLSRLTKLFIHKPDSVGTGPYKLKEWLPGDRFVLEAFKDYWGQKPHFEEVQYKVIASRVAREQSFEAGEIDLLVGVTEDQALSLPANQVITSYGLEVNFLMFRLDDPIFEERSVREAIWSLIDPARVEAIGNNFVRRSSQFIAPGVFGYNQAIQAFPYEEAKEAEDIFGQRLQRLNFDYLSSYRTLSEYLVTQLRKAGFSVRDSAVDPDDLLEKISRNESQLFLIGWRAEDGDAGSFFDAFIHSDGPFNGGRYQNEEVDRLIEQSRSEMNPQLRLTLLQEINEKVSEDLVGIPLFETSRLFAVKKGIKWKPRLDGQVLASEISQ